MSGFKNDSDDRRVNPNINIEAADKYALVGNMYSKTKNIDSERLSKSIVQKLLGSFVKQQQKCTYIHISIFYRFFKS